MKHFIVGVTQPLLPDFHMALCPDVYHHHFLFCSKKSIFNLSSKLQLIPQSYENGTQILIICYIDGSHVQMWVSC